MVLPQRPTTARETFVSVEGRFAISLPAQANATQRLSIPTPFGSAKGSSYVWTLNGGSFVAGFADASQPVDTPEVSKQIFELLREATKKLARENNGVVGPEKVIELDNHPGLEQRVDLFTGSMIQRTYLVSRRLYQTLVIIKTEQRSFEKEVTQALNTFKILSDAEVAIKLADEIAKAEPSPLPQEPVADRSGTDAGDRHLMGPVKTVLEESEDLTGTWSVQAKKRDSYEQYDQKGNLLRREFYDYKGILHTITVYGYVDGKRVGASNTIKRDNDPPPVKSGVLSQPSTPRVRARYDVKYEFKYDDKKRLTEEKWTSSTGEAVLRIVLKYSDKQIETVHYGPGGQVSQRFISVVDAKGNELEMTAYDPRDGQPAAKMAYRYEFDGNGNWTKRTTSKVTMKDGRERFDPQYVDTRTITYY